MAKYSFEFKKKIVNSYLKGEGGYNFLSQKYGVLAESNVNKWVAAYQELGDAVDLQLNQTTDLRIKLTTCD